jgi:hypothetical protein
MKTAKLASPPDGAGQDALLVTSPTRALTKKSLLLELLGRADGASINDIVASLGWLPHTTRAALTGLGKTGHEIVRTKVDGTSRYTIVTSS